MILPPQNKRPRPRCLSRVSNSCALTGVPPSTFNDLHPVGSHLWEKNGAGVGHDEVFPSSPSTARRRANDLSMEPRPTPAVANCPSACSEPVKTLVERPK